MTCTFLTRAGVRLRARQAPRFPVSPRPTWRGSGTRSPLVLRPLEKHACALRHDPWAGVLGLAAGAARDVRADVRVGEDAVVASRRAGPRTATMRPPRGSATPAYTTDSSCRRTARSRCGRSPPAGTAPAYRPDCGGGRRGQRRQGVPPRDPAHGRRRRTDRAQPVPDQRRRISHAHWDAHVTSASRLIRTVVDRG